jgi:hypothetical protein
MLTTPPPDSPLRTLLRQWRARTRPEDLGLVRGPRQTSEAGITQEQLARRAGCTLRHYAAVEAGHALPDRGADQPRPAGRPWTGLVRRHGFQQPAGIRQRAERRFAAGVDAAGPFP